jgi:hypothetical protein
VARGAVVREALVLPETYLSGGVTLEHSVVQGNVVQDLRWSARMVVPLRDGVLGPLNGGFADAVFLRFLLEVVGYRIHVDLDASVFAGLFVEDAAGRVIVVQRIQTIV